MKEKIGKTAGMIWKTLKSKEEVNVLQLPRILKEKSDIVYQALGWLAREDKINYSTKNKKNFVSLTDSEKSK